MANIILPAVPVLSEIDDSTKLLIEQAGEINRYPISDLDIGGGDVTIDLNNPGGDSTDTGNPINADTLGGKPASDYVLKDELILDGVGGGGEGDITIEIDPSAKEKPQSPLYSTSNDTYFYPLTTADQVILDDGNRLDDEISKYLTVKLEGEAAEPNGINADTLGGYAADEYVLKSVLDDFIPKKIGCTYLVDLINNGIDIFDCEIIKTGSFIQGRMRIRALIGSDGDITFDRPIIKIVDFDTNIGDISRTGISSPNIHTFYIESDGIYVILSEDNTLTPGDYHIIF